MASRLSKRYSQVVPFLKATSLVFAGGLDIPIQRPFVQRDWRFGHYEFDGLQDPLSRLFRFLSGLIIFQRQSSNTGSKRYIESDAGVTEETESQETEMRVPALAATT